MSVRYELQVGEFEKLQGLVSVARDEQDGVMLGKRLAQRQHRSWTLTMYEDGEMVAQQVFRADGTTEVRCF